MKKRIAGFIAIIAAVICVCSLAGCSSEKTFTKAGMSITLTSAFYEKEHVSQTAYYESSTAMVTVLKEEFSLIPDSYSLKEYTDIVIEANNMTASSFQRLGSNYRYFTYEKSASGNDFFYLATTHKADDAYWLIQFACFAKNKDKMQETFFGWADTIVFGNSVNQ